MLHWLVAVVIIIFQEVVTFNALLFQADRGAYPLWIIHVIFVFATIFDIWIGYILGLAAKKKFTKGKIVDFANKISARFHANVGKKGRRVALLILGNFSFPYINSFIAAWLDIPFWEMFIYLFIGNLISYAISWAIVLGVASVIPGSFSGGLIVVVASLLLIACFRGMKK